MDPDTIWYAIFGQESNYGRNNKTSITGATGPGQIQPETFRAYAKPGENINNRDDNIAVSKRIVRDYYNKFGADPGRIATAYFSGPSNVSPANSITPFIKNRSDPTGKSTASYVSDISKRVSSMEEQIPDFLGQYNAKTIVPSSTEELVTDYLGQFDKPTQPAPMPPSTSTGIPYGAVHGISNILSTLAPGAQTEGGMPISGVPSVPNTEGIFKLLQSKVTGPLDPGSALGRNFGEIIPYTLMPPFGIAGAVKPAAAAGRSLLARIMGGGLSAGGQTVAGALTEGTPYQTPAELIGGLAAPTVAAKTLAGLGKTAANVTGAMSGVGAMPVTKAFTTGVEGGAAGETFRASQAGNISPQQLVDDATKALTNMRIDRSKQYLAAKGKLSQDTTVLDFGEIDKAMKKANEIKTFKGEKLQPETQGVQDEINHVIDHWKSLNPNEYHTPIGLDALKQRIGSIKDNLPFNTPQRKVAEDAYNSIRSTITKQAPEYSKMMKGYEEASDQIDEIRKTLSLNPKASVDTAFRKLLSTMRTNANTNYGQRVNLVQELERHGAPNLSAALAGQSMQSWIPHGLARAAPSLEIPAAIWAAYEGGGPKALAALATAAPFQSPRILGAGAHLAGRATGGLGLADLGKPMTVAPFAFSQANRLTNLMSPQ